MGAWRTQSGEVVYAPDDQRTHLASLGYPPAAAADVADATTQKERPTGDAVTAGVSAAASGATLGLSDVLLRALAPGAADYVSDSREAHPYISGIGELGGAVLGAHGPSPTGALTSFGERVTASTASRLGGGAAARVAARATGEAAVGAGMAGGAYVAQQALEDKPLSAEGFVGAMGKGALFGGVTGGALAGGSEALVRAKSLFPAHEVSQAVAARVDQEAASTIATAVDASATMSRSATDELRRLRIQRETAKAEQEAAIGQTKVESAQAKAEAIKAKAEADKAQAAVRKAKAEGKLPKLPEPTATAFEPAPVAAEAPVVEAAPAIGVEEMSAKEQRIAAAQENLAKAEEGIKRVRKPRQPKASDDELNAWREKYPSSATEHVTLGERPRANATQQWAEDFQPKSDADEAIKAYFQKERDPAPVIADAKTRRNARIGADSDVVTERPPEQDVANLISADAAHRAYQRATEAATNVSETGKEVFLRATYASKRAAAGASDDFFARLNAAKASGRADEFLEATRKGFRENAEGDLVRHMRGDDATATLWNDYADAVGAGRGKEWLAATKDRPFYYDDAGRLVRLGDEGAAAAVPVQQQITDALHAHVGEHVDLGAQLAEQADAITKFEAANHEMVEALRDAGAEVPVGAAQLADEYAAAAAKHSEAAAASTAKVAEDVGNKAAPALAAPEKGLGGKLADLAGLLEVAGMHIPFLHAVPVVGPLLSTFLKARAFLAIAGRRGGSVVESAEAHVAAKSATTRNRVAEAVDKMLDSSARRTSQAASYAGVVQGLGYKLFPSDTKTPKKADAVTLYHARMDELARAQQPGAVEAAVSDRVMTADVALQQEIAATMRRKLEFLASKAPKQASVPGLLKGDGDWRPGKAQLESFARYVHAAEDPASVLEDLAHAGHVSIEGAETLRVVYPSMFAEAQKLLLQKAPDIQRTLPYSRRVALSVMFNVPVDGSMSRQHLGYLQAGQPPAQPQGAAPPQPPHPSIAGGVSLGHQTMTAMDRRAGA